MPTRPPASPAVPQPPCPVEVAAAGHQFVAPMLAMLATAAILAERAFNDPLIPSEYCQIIQAAAIVLFAADRVWLAGRRTDGGHGFGQCWVDVVAAPIGAIAAVLAGAPVLATALTAGAIYVAIHGAMTAAASLLGGLAESRETALPLRRGLRNLVTAYLLLTVLGGALLAVPAATISDHRNSPYTHTLNSLFLAGSAATCTGLSVYDFPREYTLYGQLIVLLLIQAGGLAAMIFGTVLGLSLVRRLWPGNAAWSIAMDAQRLGRLIRAIIITTLGLEAVGASLIYAMQPDTLDVLGRAFHAAFLAVSAFCSAGLSLERNSLMEMAGLGGVYGVIMPLVILGGMGFPVLYEIGRRMAGDGDKAAAAPLLPLPSGRWSLHGKVVLGGTMAVIVAGAAALWCFETPWRYGGFWYVGNSNVLAAEDAIQTSGQTMRGHTDGQRAFDALFQSASARTSGFRTVAIKPGAISPAGLTTLAGLMLAGGAAGSTAGGFHIGMLAVLLAATVGALRGRRQTNLMGATVPDDVVRSAFAVLVMGLTWWGLTILVLTHVQRADFLAIVFEATSALSANGLSLGLTANLTVAGKVMLLLTMLVGRIGPIALLLVMTNGAATDIGRGPAVRDREVSPADAASSEDPLVLG